MRHEQSKLQRETASRITQRRLVAQLLLLGPGRIGLARACYSAAILEVLGCESNDLRIRVCL